MGPIINETSAGPAPCPFNQQIVEAVTLDDPDNSQLSLQADPPAHGCAGQVACSICSHRYALENHDGIDVQRARSGRKLHHVDASLTHSHLRCRAVNAVSPGRINLDGLQ